MKPYDARDWYWRVTGVADQVFSSASGDYVADNDATFVAWQSDGTLPSNINSEAELGAVLAEANVRPSRAAVLDGYKTKHAMDIVDAVQFKIMFNHENRLRAIERSLGLNGSPADLTAQQARNAVKALM